MSLVIYFDWQPGPDEILIKLPLLGSWLSAGKMYHHFVLAENRLIDFCFYLPVNTNSEPKWDVAGDGWQSRKWKRINKEVRLLFGLKRRNKDRTMQFHYARKCALLGRFFVSFHSHTQAPCAFSRFWFGLAWLWLSCVSVVARCMAWKHARM